MYVMLSKSDGNDGERSEEETWNLWEWKVLKESGGNGKNKWHKKLWVTLKKCSFLSSSIPYAACQTTFPVFFPPLSFHALSYSTATSVTHDADNSDKIIASSFVIVCKNLKNLKHKVHSLFSFFSITIV